MKIGSHVLVLSILLLILLYRCSSNSNPTTQNKSNNIISDTNQIGSTIPILDNHTVKTLESKEINFKSKYYFFTNDFDDNNCKPLTRCDCCSSELYFIDQTKYLAAELCEGGTNYYKGTYIIQSESLILQHDSLYVYNLEPFGDDEESNEFGTFKDFIAFEAKELKFDRCSSKFILIDNAYTPPDIGIEQSKTQLLADIWQNTNSEILELLEISKSR